MSSEKIARLLTDFDQKEPQKGSSRVVPFDHTRHSAGKAAPPPKPAAPQDDPYQRGKLEGYAAVLTEYDQKLAEQRGKFDAQLVEERQKWLDETAGKVAEGVKDVGNQLEAKIAQVVGRILEPLVTNVVQKQAVATFVEQLASITSDSRRPTLRISGPAELLDAVRSKIGVRAMAMEFRTAQTGDISVIVDDAVLETQVKLWTERLKYAVTT
ncbi:hypothetical protein MXD81_03060 [Microbacteriaceae bacterium K1510]|nr:hypothetical protein [Microbacteriaceae bacterium K1510]